MKLGIDAMSGDLGSRIVVEACLSFFREKLKQMNYMLWERLRN